MTTTYRDHFDQDIMRAESLVDLAGGKAPAMNSARRREDLRLAAVAMAVGAMDAYFCDAYVDCLTRALRQYADGNGPLPDAYARRYLPAGEVLSSSHQKRPNWRLRMAARAVMEKENVLDLSQVPTLFNPVLPLGQKVWPAAMEPLINLGSLRLTGVRPASYRAASSNKRAGMRNSAAGKVKTRVGETIQWRHDWVHNCGRPKEAIQDKTQGQIVARITEIRALVEAFDDHLDRHRTV